MTSAAPAPFWIEIQVPDWFSVTPQYYSPFDTVRFTAGVVDPPQEILTRASQSGKLYAWMQDGLAGLVLNGKSICWEAQEFPAAVAIEYIGKGRGAGYVCVELRQPAKKPPPLIYPPVVAIACDRPKATSLPEVKRIFKQLRPLFPEGTSVSPYPDVDS